MKTFIKIWNNVLYGINKVSLKIRICFYVSLNRGVHKFDNKITELRDRYEVRYTNTIHGRQKLAERMAMDISNVYGEMVGARASEFVGVGSVYTPLYITNALSNVADQNYAVGIALGGVNRGEVLSSRGEALYSRADGSPLYESFSYIDTAYLQSYNNIVEEENALNNYLASQNNIKEENRLKEKRSNVKNSIEQLEIGD